jgi:hypothetical protein
LLAVSAPRLEIVALGNLDKSRASENFSDCMGVVARVPERRNVRSFGPLIGVLRTAAHLDTEMRSPDIESSSGASVRLFLDLIFLFQAIEGSQSKQLRTTVARPAIYS